MLDIVINKIDLPGLSLGHDFLSEHLQIRSSKVPGYESYYVKKNVSTMLEEIFPSNFLLNTTTVGQIIDSRLNQKIHKDGKRKFALNYLLDSGGEDVITTVYNEDKSILTQLKQEVGNWVILNTQYYHAVENITHKRLHFKHRFRLYNTDTGEFYPCKNLRQIDHSHKTS